MRLHFAKIELEPILTLLLGPFSQNRGKVDFYGDLQKYAELGKLLLN